MMLEKGKSLGHVQDEQFKLISKLQHINVNKCFV